MVKALLRRGALQMARDNTAHSVVLRSILWQPERIIHLLIVSRATTSSRLNEEVNTADETGITPLHFALLNGHTH